MEFSEVIASRHSVRIFTEDQVPQDVLDTILQETQTAPSSKNSKSSAFMIVKDRDTLLALSEVRESGASFIKSAAAAIVVLGDKQKSDMWIVNSSISATFLQLSVVDKGLGSCWVQVEGRKRSKYQDDPDPQVRAAHLSGMAEDYVKELLGIKDQYGVLCIIALGYKA